jgi:hypothetical protein
MMDGLPLLTEGDQALLRLLRRRAMAAGPYHPERGEEPCSVELPDAAATVYYGQRGEPRERRLIVVANGAYGPGEIAAVALDLWLVVPPEPALATMRLIRADTAVLSWRVEPLN